MTAPLYRETRQWLAANQRWTCPDQAHHGLWFERFYDGFNAGDWSIQQPSQDGALDVKRNWIDSVSGEVGDASALDAAANRRVDLIAARGGDFRCLRTDWHLVTGLGLPHPIENGFAWHPTLGVPYLAGAAVKGLVRAYLEAWQDPIDRTKIARWLGTESKDDVPERAGDLVFFDALPISQPKLGCDVMTPHMDKWYELGGETPLAPKVTPGDWHSPVPVPFLVVEAATLLFGIAPRRRADAAEDQAKADLAECLDSLAQALDWLGAGAKTAAGYGHMRPDDDGEQQLREALEQRREEKRSAQDRARMSPAEREVQEYLDGRRDNHIGALIEALESSRFKDAETIRTAAEKARHLLQQAGTWMPDFSGTNKTKIKHRDRSLKIRDIIEWLQSGD